MTNLRRIRVDLTGLMHELHREARGVVNDWRIQTAIKRVRRAVELIAEQEQIDDTEPEGD